MRAAARSTTAAQAPTRTRSSATTRSAEAPSPMAARRTAAATARTRTQHLRSARRAPNMTPAAAAPIQRVSASTRLASSRHAARVVRHQTTLPARGIHSAARPSTEARATSRHACSTRTRAIGQWNTATQRRPQACREAPSTTAPHPPTTDAPLMVMGVGAKLPPTTTTPITLTHTRTAVPFAAERASRLRVVLSVATRQAPLASSIQTMASSTGTPTPTAAPSTAMQ